MILDDFDYTLAQTQIAQFPTDDRRASRLMVLEPSEQLAHNRFPALLNYITDRDLLVFNDTRVIPARLFGEKASGGKIECLIERILADYRALAYIRASHAPKIGSTIILEKDLRATVLARQEGLFELLFAPPKDGVTLSEALECYGHLPLPPYITRAAELLDMGRYQTVYAKHTGAVAAPTAGLHFDEDLLAALVQKNVETSFLTLHVGAGTFQPVRTEKIEAHVMHSEWFTVSASLCDQVAACKKRGGRVIAVGTTVVRALESAAMLHAGILQPYTGETRIFITPGFQFRVVDSLLTNFHLPKSTLLMLVCAFGGYARMMNAYQVAIAHNYRFFSYGDAMLILNRANR